MNRCMDGWMDRHGCLDDSPFKLGIDVVVTFMAALRFRGYEPFFPLDWLRLKIISWQSGVIHYLLETLNFSFQAYPNCWKDGWMKCDSHG